MEHFKNFDIPGTTKVYEFLSDKMYFYVLEEYVEGKSIFRHVLEKEVCTEGDIAEMAKLTLSSLQSVHSKELFHSDINPANIIIANPFPQNYSDFIDSSQGSPLNYQPAGGGGSLIIKMGNFFNLVNFEAEEKYMKKYIVPYYLSPENVIFEMEEETLKKQAGDTWSVGAVLFVLMTGKYPVKGDRDVGIMQNIRQKHVNFDHCSDLSSSAHLFLQKLLDYNDMARNDLLVFLKDPWVLDTQDESHRHQIKVQAKLFRVYVLELFREALLTYTSILHFDYDYKKKIIPIYK